MDPSRITNSSTPANDTAGIQAEDIKNATEFLATDLIIVYGLCQIHQYVADDSYRFMGLTESGKSNVRGISYTFFSI